LTFQTENLHTGLVLIPEKRLHEFRSSIAFCFRVRCLYMTQKTERQTKRQTGKPC